MVFVIVLVKKEVLFLRIGVLYELSLSKEKNPHSFLRQIVLAIKEKINNLLSSRQ